MTQDSMRGGVPRALLCGGLVALGASAAHAGPLDRSGRPIDAIFEPGGYAELSFGFVMPDTTGGTRAGAPPPGIGGILSEDVSENFAIAGAALKFDLTPRLSAALIYDQPFGAGLDYPDGTGFFAAGVGARVDTHALTGLVRYEVTPAVSVLGGVRYQTYDTDTQVPLLVASEGPNAGVPYAVVGERDGAFGYVLGAAYEVPGIGARVALSYHSEISHDLDTVETGPVPGRSRTNVTTPRSAELSVRSGIAPGTLLFGSVRWTDYSSFEVTPVGFEAATGGGSILDYDEDTFDYTIGVGRQFSDRWLGSAAISYAAAAGGLSDVFGTSDGAVSLDLGATYVLDRVEISAGVSYVRLGDSDVSLDGETVAATFEDNDAVAVGIRIARRF